MNSIKILIVEDEKPTQGLLMKLLESFNLGLDIIGVASSIKETFDLILNQAPDLVLLDINIKGGDTFSLLKQLGKIKFKIVFITSYDEYALKAIKYSAVDYVLKPINSRELYAAIIKSINQIVKDDYLKFKVLKDSLDIEKPELKKIVLNSSDETSIIRTSDILRLEASGSYTKFHTKVKTIINSKPIGYYEGILIDESFFFMRVHKSHIINTREITKYLKLDGGYILLSDGSKIPIGLTKKDEVLKFIKNINKFI